MVTDELSRDTINLAIEVALIVFIGIMVLGAIKGLIIFFKSLMDKN